MCTSQNDLLHPLTSLKWSKCEDTPGDMEDAQAVVCNATLYLYIKTAIDSYIQCYDSNMKILIKTKSPTHHSAFITYQNKFTSITHQVLVGGLEVATKYFTNKLWCLLDDGTWDNKIIPPMPSPRHSAAALSIRQHIIVAGGIGVDGAVRTVEVFDGTVWLEVEPLPAALAGKKMQSVILNGEWYLMGGTLGRSVFCARIDALLANNSGNVWKKLPETPFEKSSPAVFDRHLLAIGGQRHRSKKRGTL